MSNKMQRKWVTCDTPGCTEEIAVPSNSVRRRGAYYFCKTCRKNYSYPVLVTQVQHGYGIQQVILDAASMFNNVSGIAAYVGVSFVTIYNWLEKYFGMSFQEFKRTYICKSPKCYILNIQGSPYCRYDYILKKIKRQRYCACSSVLDSNQLMTNAPIDVVEKILRGNTRVEKLNDSAFMLVPEPVRLTYPVSLGIFPVSL